MDIGMTLGVFSIPESAEVAPHVFDGDLQPVDLVLPPVLFAGRPPPATVLLILVLE